jgi:tRNA-Thr(GGU) m(6)t(6)A37 methyltransferase TsaA
MEMPSFSFVGVIESCYPDRFGTPRQPGLSSEAESVLVISPEWQPEISLQGLNEFSHIWVIFLFHKNTNQRFHAKVHPPRLKGESRGVFATRSPHRPNPVGLSVVKIKKIEGNRITVQGGDFVDGTPILDLKPYLPVVESIPEAKSAWAGEDDQAQQRQVEWSEEAQLQLLRWQHRHPEKKLQLLVEETLRLDPRPNLYKGFEGQESPYRNSHALRLYEGDIHFRFITDSQILVERIVLV